MKIVSWNVNGLRSVSNKGFGAWMKKENPDIVCLQEIKARKNQLVPELLKPQGYYPYIRHQRLLLLMCGAITSIIMYTKER